MSLAHAFRRVATASQHYFGGSGNVVVTRPGVAPVTLSAVIYREKTSWRRNSNGDREEVITRSVQLPPATVDIPIGSTFVAEGLAYTVEQVAQSPASGAQTMHGVRSAYASVSRPGYYGS